MLSLAEDIFLLSLLEKKESIRFSTSISLPFSLAGAVLIDLVLSNYAKLEDGRLLLCDDSGLVLDDRLKLTLERIRQARKPVKLDHWVQVLSTKGKRMSKDIILSLVERGIILRAGKYYQLAPMQNEGLPEQPPSKYLLKREIRDAVFFEKTVPEHLFARVELMNACDMLDHLFTNDEIIAVRKKIKTLKSEEHYSPGFLDLMNRINDSIKFAIASAISK